MKSFVLSVLCLLVCGSIFADEPVLVSHAIDGVKHYAVRRVGVDSHPAFGVNKVSILPFSTTTASSHIDGKWEPETQNIIPYGENEYRSGPERRGIYSVRFHPANDKRAPTIREYVVAFKNSAGEWRVSHAGLKKTYPLSDYSLWGKFWIPLDDKEAKAIGLDAFEE